jgi:hypothetical protein
VVDPGVIGTALPRSERDILVHGTAAQAEFDKPGPPNEIEYRGWGAVVPAPIAVGGSTAFSDLGRLVRLELRYEVPPGGDVRNLHLWDADSRFFYWDFPAKVTADLQFGNTELKWRGNHAIANSLGVSIGVIFPTAIDSQEPPSAFTLFSARAHLE